MDSTVYSIFRHIVIYYVKILRKKGDAAYMVFSSPIFLFVFLPLVYVSCRLLPKTEQKNVALAVFSLIFYSFGQLSYVPLFLASIFVNYTAGLLLQRQGDAFRRCVMVGAVVLNLGVLGVYKYTDFILGNINAVFSSEIPLPALELPIGISFFTFQGMSYVIDVYRDRHSGSRSVMTVLLYIAFFPQLIAGPIVKYHDIACQIRCREETAEQTAQGIRRFIVGLSKKVLLSNSLGFAADCVFNEHLASAMDYRLAWLGGICYMMQIYYDFSGYSDMAIGMAGMFGFRLKENFRYPYAAASIKEFWRRWHISLSTWFKEYVYIPLGGNRHGKMRAAVNRMIVFLCTGIWHGANWTFILWGVLHGCLSALEDFGVIPTEKLQATKLGRAVSRVYTLLCVMLLFVLFRADSVADGLTMMGAMFRFQSTAEGTFVLLRLLNGSTVAALAAAVVLCGGVTERIDRSLQGSAVYDGAKYLGSLVLLLLSMMSLSMGGYNPFIYFQF